MNNSSSKGTRNSSGRYPPTEPGYSLPQKPRGRRGDYPLQSIADTIEKGLGATRDNWAAHIVLLGFLFLLSAFGVVGSINDAAMSYIVYGRTLPGYVNIPFGHQGLMNALALGVSLVPQVAGIAISLGARLKMEFAERRQMQWMYYALTVFDIGVDFYGCVYGHPLTGGTLVWGAVIAVGVNWLMSEIIAAYIIPQTISSLFAAFSLAVGGALNSVKAWDDAKSE